MSRFAVTIERLARVWEHPNADRLALAQVESMSYQFVIAKGAFQTGDLVVYFPIDSLLPPPIISKLQLEGRLSGVEQNRLKTVRLRGEISQGIVGSPSLLLEQWDAQQPLPVGQEVTELLGVSKYEVPHIAVTDGRLVGLPPLVSVYDIEGAERFGAVVAQLMATPVLITEKLEGSHFAITLNIHDEISVSQRRYKIEPIDGKQHDWHRLAQALQLPQLLPQLRTALQERGLAVDVLTLRGEVIGTGIQNNYYRLKQQQLKFFEMEVNGQALGGTDFVALAQEFALPTVPILAAGVTLGAWLDQRVLASAADGVSAITPTCAREGIVIRPMQEMIESGIGRVILKQRSPNYLAASDF
jgi:RNA ligase (TIGR02306 family)